MIYTARLPIDPNSLILVLIIYCRNYVFPQFPYPVLLLLPNDWKPTFFRVFHNNGDDNDEDDDDDDYDDDDHDDNEDDGQTTTTTTTTTKTTTTSNKTMVKKIISELYDAAFLGKIQSKGNLQ